MHAFVITGPGEADVQDVAPPEPRRGEVVVSIERAGVCGTDVDIFTGKMSYLHTGQARYPIRPGHEWAGVVSAVGEGAAAYCAEVHLLGRTTRSLAFARCIGFEYAWTRQTLPGLRYDAVIDASNAAASPAFAADLLEPGRRVVYAGLADDPSLVDTRTLV